MQHRQAEADTTQWGKLSKLYLKIVTIFILKSI